MNPTNENTIRALLRRFMDGETSLDDERLLAEYFRDHPVPEDLRPYHDMFAWFDRGMPPAATPACGRSGLCGRSCGHWCVVAAPADCPSGRYRPHACCADGPREARRRTGS